MSHDEPLEHRPVFESYGKPGSGLLRFENQGMGTWNVLLLCGLPERDLREAAQEAFDRFGLLEQALSKFLPSSDVSLLNVLGSNGPVAVGQDLIRVLIRAREAWEVTGGAFDPTIGSLMDAWGFTTQEGRVPDESERERLLESRGMNHVAIHEEAGTVEFDVPGVSIDLGAIAKGYAVDQIVGVVQGRGVPVGAFISGRSSIVTWGAPPGEERWRFEVLHPGDPEEILRVLLVEPGAISSSGSAERRFFRGGREYGHVLDPRTAQPAKGIKGVTAWTEGALLGDVLSTTLFVLGADSLAKGREVERLLEKWHSGPGFPRASVLLVLENTAVWGGIEVKTCHFGRPGFVTEEA